MTKNLKIDFKNSKKIKLDKNNNDIYSLLDGKIVNFQGKTVLPLADLIKKETLKKIFSKFKIKNKIKFIKGNKKNK